jgi:hypothetical protein
MLAGLFLVVVVGAFAVGLFSSSPDTEVAGVVEGAAPDAPRLTDAESAVGVVAKAPSARTAVDTQEELATQRRAEALAVRRARAARISGAKPSKASQATATRKARAGTTAGAKSAAGSAANAVVGDDVASAAPSKKGQVLSTAQQRRAKRRALRLAGREKRLAEREELAEARALNGEGTLTREELRDLRRGQRDRTRAERDVERLARHRARDDERNAELAPVVMRAEVEENEIGIPPGDAAAAAGAPGALTQVVSALPGPPPEPPAGRVADIRRWSPSGQPKVAIQILQWSTNNARRFAYVSLDGGRATQVREGDQIGTLKVTRIYREVIEFGHDGGSFLLRAN